MPRLKWLMFEMPMSSPQRIRMLGLSAISAPFRFVATATYVWLIVARRRPTPFPPSRSQTGQSARSPSVSIRRLHGLQIAPSAVEAIPHSERVPPAACSGMGVLATRAALVHLLDRQKRTNIARCPVSPPCLRSYGTTSRFRHSRPAASRPVARTVGRRAEVEPCLPAHLLLDR